MPVTRRSSWASCPGENSSTLPTLNAGEPPWTFSSARFGSPSLANASLRILSIRDWIERSEPTVKSQIRCSSVVRTFALRAIAMSERSLAPRGSSRSGTGSTSRPVAVRSPRATTT